MKQLLGPLILLFSLSLQSQDTLTLMHYNLLNYGNNYGGCTESNNSYVDKTEYLKTILNYVKPDILTVNEINESFLYHDYLLNNALNVNGIDYYQRGNPPNYASSYIINQIFYNTEKLTMISNLAIETNYRDIDIFRLKVEQTGLQNEIYLNCVIAHLKAGNETSDENERANETSKLMNYLDNANTSGNYTLSGDLNLYTASEQAFQNLLFYSDTDIRFYDPMNMIGEWSNNEYFATVHTQSTHYSSNNCFSSGGLDDRFDFILVSDEVLFGTNKMKYTPGSYKALGQDGEHFNNSLTASPQNNSVPEEVLYSLYNMSDHLPIVMDILVGDNLSMGELNNDNVRISIRNPVTSQIEIYVTVKNPLRLNFSLKNLQGQLLLTEDCLMVNPDNVIKLPASSLYAGIYFLVISDVVDFITTQKIIKR